MNASKAIYEALSDGLESAELQMQKAQDEVRTADGILAIECEANPCHS